MQAEDTLHFSYFISSRGPPSGRRRRPYHEAEELQSGRGQEGRVDPRLHQEIPQNGPAGAAGESRDIHIVLLEFVLVIIRVWGHA